MNILITGASRGIGAAAYALLKSSGHCVVGHSSKGSDELVAGDLSDPTAPRNIWETALAADSMSSTIAAIRTDTENVAKDIDEVEQGFGRFSEQIANFKSTAKAFVNGMVA